MNNKLIPFLLFFLLNFEGFSQVAPNKYFITFTDKENSNFNVSQPLDFLSQRALDRRQKHNITITEQDLPVNQNYVNEILNIGVDVLYTSKWLNGALIYTTDSTKINQIEQLPFVENARNKKYPSNIKNPVFKDKWEDFENNFTTSNLSTLKSNFDYGIALQQIIMHEGEYLHQQDFLGNNILIAVLDAGFRNVDDIAAFDKLFLENKILATYDFVDIEENVYNDHPHGTLVLSSMAAYSPGNIVGTSPEASYILLRSEDAATEFVIEEYNWLKAAEYADSAGADIINSSLGYTVFQDTSQSYTYDDMDGETAISSIAANIAADKGILVVNSAGNLGGSAWNFIAAPADAQNVLTVGAINPSAQAASFSSEGPTADGRLKPNVVAIGQSTVVVDAFGNVITSNGTSFSAPIIAGFSACLMEALPNLSPSELIETIQNASHLVNQPNNKLGYGIPSFKKALLNVSSQNTSNKNKLEVYPNPFKNHLNIAWVSDNKLESIIVYDFSGKEIENRILSNDYRNQVLKFDTEKWQNGMYFLSFGFENGDTYFQKIIKQ